MIKVSLGILSTMIQLLFQSIARVLDFIPLYLGFQQFLNHYQTVLTKNCSDRNKYSHCQKYSLFRYSPSSKTCSSWRRMPCCFEDRNWIVDVHREYTGVTVVIQISLDRVNRIPFHLQRWNGPIIIVVFMSMNEIDTAWTLLSQYENHNLEFILYVVEYNRSDSIFLNSQIHLKFNTQWNLLPFWICCVILELSLLLPHISWLLMEISSYQVLFLFIY